MTEDEVKALIRQAFQIVHEAAIEEQQARALSYTAAARLIQDRLEKPWNPETPEQMLSRLLNMPVVTTNQFQFEWFAPSPDLKVPYIFYNFTQVFRTPGKLEDKDQLLKRHIETIKDAFVNGMRYRIDPPNDHGTLTGGRKFWSEDFPNQNPTCRAHQHRALTWRIYPPTVSSVSEDGDNLVGEWLSDVGYQPVPSIEHPKKPTEIDTAILNLSVALHSKTLTHGQSEHLLKSILPYLNLRPNHPFHLPYTT